ncbi:MAG: FliH/SctL family protein [Tepidisphaeraceae bacterium]|jgi:flagellar assembly protein FliH
MPLIKSSLAPSSVRVFSMADIEKQAQALIMCARQQADQMLAGARAEAETIKERARAEGAAEGSLEGHNRGRTEGQKAGREEATRQMAGALTSAVAALNSAAAAIDSSRRELEGTAVHDVLELALLLADRITRRQGRIDRSVAIANVTEAVRLVVGATAVRIAISPADRAVLEETLPAIRLQLSRLQHIELVTEDSMAPGGCRVFTAGGEIDATLDTQLARIAADLMPDHEEPVS